MLLQNIVVFRRSGLERLGGQNGGGSLADHVCIRKGIRIAALELALGGSVGAFVQLRDRRVVELTLLPVLEAAVVLDSISLLLV